MYKNIAIIGAMDEEIEVFINEFKISKRKTIAGKNFYETLVGNKKIIITKSGVGKVNAAMATQVLIDIFEVDSVLNTGVAGGVNEEVEIGDIVISSDVIQHDFDVQEYGYEKGFIPSINKKSFQADSKLISLCTKHQDGFLINRNCIHVGRVLTGDQFVSCNEKVSSLWQDFKGLCVEMEGGAIGQVCYLNNIPFLIIRSISDKANSSAKIDYKNFMKKAARNSYLMTKKIIELL